MNNLGLMLHVFLLSSFLAAAATAAPTFYNYSDATNATNLQGIECDSCKFVTHKIDNYVFHNEKVMGFVIS